MTLPAEPIETVETDAPELRPVLSIPAFATPIDTYEVAGHATLNPELLEAIAAWRAAEKGIDASNQLGWHSPRSLFERNEPAFRRLSAHIDRALEAVVRRSWKQFDPGRHVALREGWVNVNGRGGFNVPHDHVTYHYSGCYYVASKPGGAGRSGGIEFLSPIGVSPAPLPNGARITPPKITFLPRAGRLFIFPSYLRHWVYPNQDEEERVSIAFNVTLGPG